MAPEQSRAQQLMGQPALTNLGTTKGGASTSYAVQFVTNTGRS